MSTIRTYHLVVKATRFFLLLALGSVVSGLVVIPLFLQPSQSRPRILTPYRISALKNQLHKAKYCATHQGNPYCITAQKAHNITDTKIALLTPQSTLHQGLRDLSLASEEGLYDRAQGTLFLNENVHLTTSDGYVFQAPNATLCLNDNEIHGAHGVTGRGPLGSLKAAQFEIHNQGEKIILKGPSKLVIERD